MVYVSPHRSNCGRYNIIPLPPPPKKKCPVMSCFLQYRVAPHFFRTLLCIEHLFYFMSNFLWTFLPNFQSSDCIQMKLSSARQHMCWRMYLLLKLSLIVPRNSGKNPENVKLQGEKATVSNFLGPQIIFPFHMHSDELLHSIPFVKSMFLFLY